MTSTSREEDGSRLTRTYRRRAKSTYAKVTVSVKIKPRGKKAVKFEKPLNVPVSEDDVKKLRKRAQEEGFIIKGGEE